MKFSTSAIHLGNEPNLKKGGSGDVVVPIHLSTTFARKKVSRPTSGYEYSRTGNPTRFALEKNLASLENGKFAFAYSSGLAAITNVLLLLRSGVASCRLMTFTAAQEDFFVKFLPNLASSLVSPIL